MSGVNLIISVTQGIIVALFLELISINFGSVTWWVLCIVINFTLSILVKKYGVVDYVKRYFNIK